MPELYSNYFGDYSTKFVDSSLPEVHMNAVDQAGDDGVSFNRAYSEAELGVVKLTLIDDFSARALVLRCLWEEDHSHDLLSPFEVAAMALQMAGFGSADELEILASDREFFEFNR